MAFQFSAFGNSQFFTSNGGLAVGYKLYTYLVGTTTKTPVYTDVLGTTPHTNPIILNSLGMPPAQILIDTGKSYKFVYATPTDTDPPASPVSTTNNINASSTADSFSVTATGSTTARTLAARFAEGVNVKDYGAVGDGVANDTAAVNAAIAAGTRIYFPTGNYLLNALTTIPTSKILEGNGRGSRLIFNTSSDAIVFNVDTDISPAQSGNFIVRDLAFDNVTSVPSSFIKNGSSGSGSINSLIERCYFSECAATYCIDNYIGYGTRIYHCVFNDITGSGVRLQDSLGQVSGYSFVAQIDGCDFTRLSGDGVVIEGGTGIHISHTVIESVVGVAVRALCLTNSVGLWNIIFDTVYFEGNTGTDIDLSDCNGAYWVLATLRACTFNGTPSIALGVKSKVSIIGTSNGGGSAVTISGSDNACVTLVDCLNFIQSGTFNWIEIDNLTNTTVPRSYTPTWGAAGDAPVLGDGTLTGLYTRIGKLVTTDIILTIGATTTTGTLAWHFSLPFTPANDQRLGGLVSMQDTAAADWTGVAIVRTSDVVQVGMTSGGTTNNGNSRAQSNVPFTWGTGDILRINATYMV